MLGENTQAVSMGEDFALSLSLKLYECKPSASIAWLRDIEIPGCSLCYLFSLIPLLA